MNWDEYAFNILEAVRQKSKDTSVKIGCVILDNNYNIVSTGFNGFPRGVKELEDRFERPIKYMYTEHAERNAIYSAASRGIMLKDCILYVDWFPCCDCARAIIQSGIKTVILNSNSTLAKDVGFNERWKESMEITKSMFEESGVNIRIIKI